MRLSPHKCPRSAQCRYAKPHKKKRESLNLALYDKPSALFEAPCRLLILIEPFARANIVMHERALSNPSFSFRLQILKNPLIQRHYCSLGRETDESETLSCCVKNHWGVGLVLVSWERESQGTGEYLCKL